MKQFVVFLLLSGFLCRRRANDLAASSQPAGKFPRADDSASTGALANNQTQAFDAKGNAAVRIFRPGAKIAYVYEVLNTQHAPGNPPQVLEQVRLFRDGQHFYANSATPLDFHGQTDLLHLTAGGLIRLGPQFAPGDYAMQVIVTDKLAKKEKYRSVSQWMNFEVE
jgi:hypothetical protein